MELHKREVRTYLTKDGEAPYDAWLGRLRDPRHAVLSKPELIRQTIGVEAMPRSKSYQEDLMKALEDPLEAQEYLNAALEDEPEIFLMALRDVAKARLGEIKQLADETKLSRESLYRMLSGKENPELKSLSAILSTLGFRLAVEQQ